MKHVALALMLLVPLLSGCASTGDPGRPVARFESCEEMHGSGWPFGVRSRWQGEADFERPDLAEGTTRRTDVTRREHRTFELNEHLDTDNDGHACEVDETVVPNPT